MKKGIIIIGPKSSGKSLQAKKIASQYPEKNVMILDGKDIIRNSTHFYFGGCEENTELLIIDEVVNANDIGSFVNFTEGIMVNKQGRNPFHISPKIVVVCAPHISRENVPTQQWFTNRFDLIECNVTKVTEDKCKLHNAFTFCDDNNDIRCSECKELSFNFDPKRDRSNIVDLTQEMIFTRISLSKDASEQEIKDIDELYQLMMEEVVPYGYQQLDLFKKEVQRIKEEK